MPDPLIIGVTGGSGSGKSLFVHELLKHFASHEICLVTQDNYYKKRTQQPVDANGVKNFDLPESIDSESLFQDILSLKQGKEVQLTEYTFNNPKSIPNLLTFHPAPVLIVEGIMVFYWQRIRELMDLKVFVDATDSIKLQRRIARDAQERGYDIDDVMYRYKYHVAPFYNQFLAPYKDEVDLVIPNNTNFHKGLAVLAGYIRHYLDN